MTASDHPVYLFVYLFLSLSLSLSDRIEFDVDLISFCTIEYMREWQFDFRSFWDFLCAQNQYANKKAKRYFMAETLCVW